MSNDAAIAVEAPTLCMEGSEALTITPEMIEAGASVLLEFSGEVSRSTLAKEIFSGDDLPLSNVRLSI